MSSSKFSGIYRGVVVDSVDPLRRGRLRLAVPALLGNATTGWASPVIPNPASLAPNSTVWVMFESGDLQRPLYFVGSPSVDGGGGSVGAASAPIGTTMPWPGPVATIPAEWREMNGQELSILMHPTLYSMLTNNGLTFPHGTNTNGSGAAGSTHFRLPDTRGRAVVGLDPSQVEFDTVGETGGAKSVTLTAAQSGLPSHTHPLTMKATVGSNDTNDGAVRGYTNTDNNFRSGTPAANASYGSASTADASAQQAHTNLQPYLTLPMIIKVTSSVQVDTEFVTQYPSERFSMFDATNNTIWSGGWPAGLTLVPGMQITIPAAAYDRTAFVDSLVVHTGNHPNYFMIFVNGAQRLDNTVSDQSGGVSVTYKWTLGAFRLTIPANQVTTVEVRSQGAYSLSGSEIQERALMVDVLPGLGNHHVLGHTTVTAADPVVNSGWVDITFNPPWINYPGFTKCQVIKEGKRVSYQGLSRSPSGTVGLIGQAPPGFRPSTPKIFAVDDTGGHRRLDISVLGEITIVNVGGDRHVSLEGIFYYVD